MVKLTRQVRRTAAPQQLYIVRRILKDKSLINEYFYQGNECTRGHKYRRKGEHWCLACATSIIQGHCGITISDVRSNFYSSMSSWNRKLIKNDFSSCWPVETKTKNHLFTMPTYKNQDKKNPDYVRVPKAAYTWYWGDIGKLSTASTCLNPKCANPLHVGSVFNYPYQPVKNNPDFGTTDSMIHSYMNQERKKETSPVHEYVRSLIDAEYRDKTIAKGFYCLWGHKERNTFDNWCFKCVDRITTGAVGFDINYTMPVYRWHLKEYFNNIVPGNFDECWILPENKRLKLYCIPTHLYEERKYVHMGFAKAVYTMFWGDVGSVRVTRSCKEKWCWNPLHYHTVFNDPEIVITSFNHCNMKMDGSKVSPIAQKRLDYAKQKLYLPLPWEKETHLTNEEPASGVIPFLEAPVLSA